jgi:hypothetical protein
MGWEGIWAVIMTPSLMMTGVCLLELATCEPCEPCEPAGYSAPCTHTYLHTEVAEGRW